jgi:DoxX-like family
MPSVASPASSRPRALAYWATTVLVVAELAVGGAWDLGRLPYVRTIVEHLGYPDYFLTILGAWKVLGAAALLAPGLPRLKEWAYAGAIFHYTGAVASHLAVGDGATVVAYPIVQTVLVAASWALRPAARRELAGSSIRMHPPPPVR